MKQIMQIAPGLVNAADPAPGIATAGQPTAGQPTAGHLESLAREGYAAVIDLRAQDEDRGFDEPEAANAAGLEYISLPLRPEPSDFEETTFERFRKLMRELGDRPALIHCRTAARVEPLLFAYLVLDRGYTPQESDEALESIEHRKEELHEQAIAYLRQQGVV